MAGAVLEWAWQVQMLLMIPALVLSALLERERPQNDRDRQRKHATEGWVLGVLFIFFAFAGANLGIADGRGRYVGLALVLFALVMEPYQRWWRAT